MLGEVVIFPVFSKREKICLVPLPFIHIIFSYTNYCKRRRRCQTPIATVTSVVIKTGPNPTLEVLNSNDHEINMST